MNNSNNFEPPKAALKSAAVSRDDNETQLTINWTLDNPTERVHLYFHFAELQFPKTNSSNSSLEAAVADLLARMLFTRNISIVVNGNVTVDSVVPLDLAVSTVDTVVKKCDGGKCSVQLVETGGSRNPPLINAMEAFTAIKFPNSETNPDDGMYISQLLLLVGISASNYSS